MRKMVVMKLKGKSRYPRRLWFLQVPRGPRRGLLFSTTNNTGLVLKKGKRRLGVVYISLPQGWRFVSFVSSAVSWYGFLIPLSLLGMSWLWRGIALLRRWNLAYGKRLGASKRRDMYVGWSGGTWFSSTRALKGVSRNRALQSIKAFPLPCSISQPWLKVMQIVL